MNPHGLFFIGGDMTHQEWLLAKARDAANQLADVIAEPAETTQDIIAMMADVEIVAAEAPGEDGKPAGPPKFSVNAYNGGALTLNRWDYPTVVDLAGVKFARSITADLHHDVEKIVGHVTDPQTDGKSITLNGLVSGTGAAAQEFLANAANGYPWQASIEASPTQTPDFYGEGEKVSVNGQDFTGPVYVVRKCNLYGIAFLPRGADDRTSVKLAASAATSQERSPMDPKLRAFILSMGGNPDTITPEQLVIAEASFKGMAPTPPPSDPAKKMTDAIEAARAEDRRQVEIADLTAKAIADNPNCGSDFINALEALAQKAIEAKWTAKDYDTELLRARRPQATPQTFQSRHVSERLTPAVIQAALCMAGGLANLDDPKKSGFNDQTLQAAKDQFPNGIGLKQVILLAARQNGFRFDTYGEVTPEAMRYAFGQMPQLQAGLSTMSLPGIFSNSAYKFLLEGWGMSDMAWGDIASRRSVRDFKTVSSYRLGGNFKYLRVAPGGEIKQGTVSEDTYSNKADTYGIRFNIGREDIINDDLNAMTSLPKEMGFGAADAMNEVFWTEFLNNSAFFASGNSNISSGVFSLANLAVAEAVFMAQTKPNGTPLAVVPKILLVPSALYRPALTAMNSNIVIDGTGTGLQGNANTFAGNFKVVTSPFLSNANFTGYSAVAFYLLADPNRLSTIEMAFLNGKEAPTIEEAQLDPSVLGFTIRGYHDFGTNLQEPRAGVRSTGA